MFCDSIIKKRIAGIITCLITVGSVAGCGASSAEIPAETAQATPQILSEETTYEVSVQIPGTLVDQIGYSAESEKTVFFKGRSLPEKFSVCDLVTGDVVYTAKAESPVYNEELSVYECVGYFSDLKTPGDYYIYTDELGESYSFAIKKDVYEDAFGVAARKYYINRCGIALSEGYAGSSARSACHTSLAHLEDNTSVSIDVSGGWHLDETARRDAAMGSRIAETLLLAYEMNPTAFGDASGIPESGNGIPDILDEVRYEAEWLLKMQDPKTGGEYGAAVTDGDKAADVFSAPVTVTKVSMDATISFAAMMARFSYFYREYDQEFATTTLRAADRAFTCFMNNQKDTGDASVFKAAVSLYRATGSESYLGVVDEFFARSDFEELFAKDENALLGSVTYLTINQQVDVDRCTYLMKLLMKASEEVAHNAPGALFNSGYITDKNGLTGMLSDMRILTITDHIIYNYEYTTIIENHIHYLAGMNPEAVNFLTADTGRTFASENLSGVMNDPERNALLIFMLSVLEQ